MAQELQKKNDLVTKTATNQPAESGSWQEFSETQSMPVRNPIFGIDQEVDKPSLSKLHEIILSDTNSSMDKAKTKVPPQTSVPLRKMKLCIRKSIH